MTPPGEPALHGGRIPLFRPGDLDAPGPLQGARDTVTELGARHGRLLPPGSVLVSCIGLLGKVGLTTEPALTNQQITALIPRPGILPAYVYYWAQTLRPWLYQHASATTLPIVNKSRLGRAPFPLVPLTEQQRIVTELHAATTHHQRATTELAEVSTLLGQLRRSLLTAALRGELGPSDQRSPTPFPPPPLVPLGDVVRMQVGFAFRSDWFAPRGVRLLRGVNVAPGTTSWSQVEYLPDPLAARYDAYLLQANDVVIGLDRPVITSGIRAAKLTPADLPALLVQRVARLTPSNPRLPIDSDYLLLCLHGESLREHLLRHATGTQLPHISTTTLASAVIPLPPLGTQRRITQQVTTAWQQVAATVDHHTTAQKQLGELWLALLGRAFSPQLQRPLWHR